MQDALLTLNAGSSSIKFALFTALDAAAHGAELNGEIDGIGSRPHLAVRGRDDVELENSDLPPGGEREAQHAAALACLCAWLQTHAGGLRVRAVGHRVVHGGGRFTQPVLIDDAVLAALDGFVPLAPLHQPHNLAGIRALRASLPGVPQVACFDTAFHETQPELARRFALPRAITALGVRRYGFHGLSYEYIAQALPEHLGTEANGRVIVAHLGNGASLCALQQRRSIATTMGFTAIDGLMMGTRAGSIDPGVLLYLMDFHGMGSAELTRLLYRESGLLGVSGLSQDMRTLLASELASAREAVDLYCYRAVREIGSLAAALGGLDALVFTAGIGANAAAIRERICAPLAWLGITLDPAANAANATRIGNGAKPVLVLATNEEWIIARHTAALTL